MINNLPLEWYLCKIKNLVFFVLLFTASPFISRAQNKDELAIRKVMDEQAKAWSNGDVETFMKSYWNSDSLVFIGASGPKYGYTTTLRNYRKNYPDTVAMGKLRFELDQLRRLSPDYYFVIGKFYLKRSIGDLQGHFTLLFRRINNAWLIVADHTSSSK